MSLIDEIHDPRRASWVGSAQGHAEFPIQNLPFGVFSPAQPPGNRYRAFVTGITFPRP
jgi:hypothetical protein